ncbi:uncharacterized protein LOC142765554 isoform X1 [Rhipicephalus microplus]|uniref:uncharacterized protein LOC142765554 isoform X1 n=1 Tax=Rhipicephalus microplus TaxID=6941 RepID=UPI003F6BD8B3
MKALNLLALFGATFGFFGLATSGPTGSPRIQLEDADRIIWPDIHHSAASSSFNPQAPTDRKFGPKNIDGDLRSSTIDADRIYWHDITHSSSSFNPPGDSRIIWPDIHHSAASASFHPQGKCGVHIYHTENFPHCEAQHDYRKVVEIITSSDNY